MSEKILIVDDEPNVLRGYQRVLHNYQLDVAGGGEEALAAIEEHGPYAVIVSDMRMPRMNGVELLTRIRHLAPETVRMMLTGNSDQQTALLAVNDGHIFRFLTKPCPAFEFAKALDAGLAQYRLVVAERELLTRTLSGSIRMLTDVLSLVNPVAFGRATRVRTLVRQVAQFLGEPAIWQVEIAAMLSQIGCVAVSSDTLAHHYTGTKLTPAEEKELSTLPAVGGDLVRHIPRLETVADIITYQDKRFDGGGLPRDDCQGIAIPLGSRILKVALDYDALVNSDISPTIAVSELSNRKGWYDPAVLAALCKSLNVSRVYPLRSVSVHELVDGMVLAADIRTSQGTLICAKGHEVSRATRFRLKNYECNLGICGPIQVFLPCADHHSSSSKVVSPLVEMPHELASLFEEIGP